MSTKDFLIDMIIHVFGIKNPNRIVEVYNNTNSDKIKPSDVFSFMLHERECITGDYSMNLQDLGV